jgi:hypothetical protein
MIIDLINKIFLFLFFLSSLNVIRVSYFLVQKWFDNEKFKLNERSLFLLGISISYILLCIFNGINL